MGFTLIELLVTIAIIGVLASMLLPTLARAKSKGKAMYCQNNLRQLSLACMLYTDDFQGRFPYNMGADEIVKTIARSRFYNWTSPVMDWELSPDNTNTVLLTQGGMGTYTSRNAAVYRCPNDTTLSDLQASAGWRERVRSISMNAMVGDAGEFTLSGANVNNPSYKQFFKSTDVPQPSKIFVFIEEHPDSVNDGYFLNKEYGGRWNDLPGSYHNGGANLTFADGHAEQRFWRFPSTKPAARPDAARLPFRVPSGQEGDFEWLMDHTSVDQD